jgi:hypothetical protein
MADNNFFDRCINVACEGDVSAGYLRTCITILVNAFETPGPLPPTAYFQQGTSATYDGAGFNVLLPMITGGPTPRDTELRRISIHIVNNSGAPDPQTLTLNVSTGTTPSGLAVAYTSGVQSVALDTTVDYDIGPLAIAKGSFYQFELTGFSGDVPASGSVNVWWEAEWRDVGGA